MSTLEEQRHRFSLKFAKKIGYASFIEGLRAHSMDRHVDHADDFKTICVECAWTLYPRKKVAS